VTGEGRRGTLEEVEWTCRAIGLVKHDLVLLLYPQGDWVTDASYPWL
jgi:hypothetical protein